MTSDLIYLNKISEREREIIPLLAEGLSNAEIGDRLFLATNTVKYYVRQLNSKLYTSNRDEIVARAQELGLFDGSAAEPDQPRHNIPRQLSPFIGRDAELEELHQVLSRDDTRLVTILAPGGMGKTRLALEAAEQQIDRHANGVYFIPLQAVEDVRHIVPTIATHTGFQFSGDNRSSQEQLLDFLANKEMLLVLDNFEQLVGDVEIISAMLQAAPRLQILLTSREKLNLSIESIFILRGMEFPAWETPADALRYDAVQLLLRTAQRVKSNWQVTADNLDYVARVCRLTEGMPLAILLAISWLDVLSLAEIAAEIEKSLDFLQTDMRDVPQRQQSIRAIFNYAWHKLSEKEQDVFMKLSVFRGGFTREAAEQVAGANIRVLQALVNKALLQVNRAGRYDIHELLRQYAQEKLKNSGAIEAVRDAHMNYYAQFMQEYESHLKDHRQIEALNQIEAEYENIRAAWLWAVEQVNENALDVMCERLYLFANIRNRWEEIIELFLASSVLEGRISRRVRGRLLTRQGSSRVALGQHQQARELLETALEIARDYDDQNELAWTLYWSVQSLHTNREHREQALQWAEESLRLSEASGDIWGLAWAKANLGAIYAALFDQAQEAQRLMTEAYQLFKQLGLPSGIGYCLLNLAVFMVYNNDGDINTAQTYLQQALDTYHRIRGGYFQIRITGILAAIEIYQGHFGRAAGYASEAYQSASENGTRYDLLCALDIRFYLLLMQEQYQQAFAVTDEMLALLQGSNDQEQLWLMDRDRTLALCGLERYEEAASWVDKALIDGFEFARPREILLILPGKSIIFAYQGRHERALELLSLIIAMPGSRLWRDRHPLVKRLQTELQAHFDEAEYQAIREHGQAQADNWREVVQELVDETQNQE